MNKLNKWTQEGLNAILGTNLIADGIMGIKTQEAIKTLKTILLSSYFKNKYAVTGRYDFGAIRMDDKYTNQFTDWGFIWMDANIVLFPLSTKPGWSYVLNKDYVDGKEGCAVLAEGQHNHIWELQDTGWTGKPFLKQIKGQVEIFRDNDLDTDIDRTIKKVGYFGINFHSWKNFLGVYVKNLSAGCQVVRVEVFDEIFPYLQAMNKQYPTGITYTLLHKNNLTKI